MSSTPPAGYDKPVPLITPENERYWQGTRDHQLWLRNCRSCNHTYFSATSARTAVGGTWSGSR